LTTRAGDAIFEMPEENFGREVAPPRANFDPDETARGVADACLARGMI
jgi:hypothetical protein